MRTAARATAARDAPQAAPAAGAPDAPDAGPAPAEQVIPAGRPLSVTEALARRLRVPHVVVCLAVAAILGGPILPYAFPDRESRLFTNVFNPHMGQIHGLPDLLYQALLFALLVFSPLGTAVMLNRLWRTPADAPALGPDVAPEIEATVRDGTRLGPPLVPSLVFLAVFLVPYVRDGYVTDAAGVIVAAVETAIVVGRFLVMFGFAWCYVRATVGLARISSRPLPLAASYQDPWLGARPLGSLALSLAATYSFGVGLATLWVLFGRAELGLLLVTVTMFVMGLVLFFVPLRAVHRQMATEKAREQAWLSDRLAALVPVSRLQPSPPATGSMADLQSTLALGIAERHVSAIRTWPFDTSILVRLASSVGLPLALTLIGRQLVLAVLGL